MRLKGDDALRRRLHAMESTTRRYAPVWGDEYVRTARGMIPVDRGTTRNSIRVARSGPDGVDISGSQVAVFIDTGTKPHVIEPKGLALKFDPKSGGNLYARRAAHPGMRARPYRVRAGTEALRRRPMKDVLIGLWNGAA